MKNNNEIFSPMHTRKGNLHLEIQTSRKNPVGIVRGTYRDKTTGKIKHTQHERFVGYTLEQLKMFQLAYREQVIPKDSEGSLKIISSREYGASKAILNVLKETGLEESIYSRSEPWVKDISAMVVGRILFAGSKLSLCNQYANTCLWETCCGIKGKVDVDWHCYHSLDKLLERQDRIQKNLAKKHLQNGHLVLYDITSTYFEGKHSESELVRFGYNRDQKKGHAQVVIALPCTSKGCPVGVEVFPGNTKDESTVLNKINELKEKYSLSRIIFVGDRGMITQSNLEKIKEEKDIRTIGALTHSEIEKLRIRGAIQLDFFHELNIHQVIDPDNPKERYCLCRNPETARRVADNRKKLIELTEEGLKQIANYKKKITPEQLGARVGKLLQRYKMGKFLDWGIQADETATESRVHELLWEWNEDKIKRESALDGCYIIRTDVREEEMDKQEVVCSYKKLGLIESAFRNLKTVQLEMRPVYHQKNDRIKAHVFLCMLAYYVQWHMMQRLKPLFEENGVGKNRRWTFRAVIDCLKQICLNQVEMNGVTFNQKTEVDQKQQTILHLLGVAI